MPHRVGVIRAKGRADMTIEHPVEKRTCSSYKISMAPAGDRRSGSAEMAKLAGAEVSSHERIR
jgi:hypothetical protein